MNPQMKSFLSSVALSACTAVAAWAANKGLIPSSDQSVIANDMVTFIFGVAALVLAWYKTLPLSQKAMIQAVNNAPNGVKVVADSATAPTVAGPLKGN